MKTGNVLLGLAVAALSILAKPATAQTAQDMEACRGGDAISSDQVIKGCDAVIAANNLGGENISLAYTKKITAAYRSKGQHDLAMGDCSKAIEMDPHAMQALYIRGAEYEARGDLDRAMADYDSVIAINASNFDALNRRAWINVKKKQYDRAIADLTQAAESNDDAIASSDTSLTRITIFGNRCWVRALAGQFDDALSDCNAALAQEISVGLLDDRGFVYFQMGQFDKAIGQYNAALRVEPQSAQSLLARGLAELKNNQRAKGDADIAAAKALQPDIAEQLAALGLQ